MSKAYQAPWSLTSLLRGDDPAPSKTVLHGIDLAVMPGEILVLVGPNGSGKTTCLKILAGVVGATSGRATVTGHAIDRDTRSAQRAVGYVPADERSFYWRLTVRENLRFFAALHGMAPSTLDHGLADVLEVLELRPLLESPFRNLSAGQRARVGIARGLLHRPKVLLLDEVTRSLDPGVVVRLHVLLKTLARERQLAILLTTHDLAEAEAVADRIGVLVEGRLVAVGDPSEVVPVARRVFFGAPS